MGDFSFRRARFHFTALDRLFLPAGKAANAIRGALGLGLRKTAPQGEYARLFQPRAGAGPSGLADLPRPFVLRPAHLEGADLAPGASLTLDVHFFDLGEPSVSRFAAAFETWETEGPGRARVRLERVETFEPRTLPLDPVREGIERITVQFVTPTELKAEGALVERPEFGILFARIRDRIATLRAIYGGGPLILDFAGLGERAASVRMARCEIEWQRGERRSGSTGRTHPLGGFTGEAEYAGGLDEFLPWLRAAEWTGVGRQTVWGKGELRVII